MQEIYQSNSSQPEPSISCCRIVVFSIIALSLLVFSIYGNSFDCSWHFDDEPNITDNPNLHLEEITWENLKRAIFSNRNRPTLPYRPVACLTFAFNHYFGGLEVFGYHLVNILIHLLSSIFLFLFIYHTLNLPSLKARYASQSYFIALVATTLWAINPVQTQAVTYIVQRMASLAGMFYIMSLFFYLKARISETEIKKVVFFILCLFSFLMAFGSKENAAMLPLTIFLCEILLFQKIARQSLRKHVGVFLIVAGAILILGFTHIYIKGGNIFSFLDGYTNRPFSLTHRLLTESRILVFYMTLLLYPVPNRLSIAHSVQISTSLFHPIWTLLSILLIAGGIGSAIYMARKRPLFSFCILFFFLNQAIESTILPLELVFEHRNYIPSMLFFLPIAIGFHGLMQLYAGKRHMRYIISVFIILLMVGFGHATFMRNFTWKNEKTLWTDAIEKAPTLSRPHHNLGRYYHDHGYGKDAILEYQKALEKPVSNRIDEAFVTYYNLGKIYSDLRDYKRALHFYYRALHLNAAFPPLYNDIAAVFDRQGDQERAFEYLIKAISLSPDNVEANLNLGLHHLKEKEPEKAVRHLEKLSDNQQFEAKVTLYLGIAFKQKGNLGRALTYFKSASAKNPRNIKLHLHKAEIFYRIGEVEAAKSSAADALSRIPDNKTFKRILSDLERKDRLSNLQPCPAIVIPLMAESCLHKSEILKAWGELLEK